VGKKSRAFEREKGDGTAHEKPLLEKKQGGRDGPEEGKKRKGRKNQISYGVVFLQITRGMSSFLRGNVA